MRYVVMAILMVVTCFNLNITLAATLSESESLEGLPGVFVLTEAIAPDAKADGLTVEAVQTATELILRSSGIRVIDAAGWVKLPQTPMLYVAISSVKSSRSGLHSLCVHVELRQKVFLAQRPESTMMVATYSIGGVYAYGSSVLGSLIPDVVEPMVKRFANAFLTANPR